MRVDTGSLTRGQVIDAAAGAGAVVVARAFQTIPGLDRALRERFAQRIEIDGALVYASPRARPRGVSETSDQSAEPSSARAAASSSQKPAAAPVRP